MEWGVVWRGSYLVGAFEPSCLLSVLCQTRDTVQDSTDNSSIDKAETSLD